MNIRFLETFVWLVRLRSFRSTAEKLHTTQPNISSRIAALEDQMRVKLYERGSKEFTLTAAGRRLLDYAERIIALSDQMQQELCVPAGDNVVLRVGIIEMVTLSWLPQLVSAIRASDVLTEVDFVTETTANLVQMLVRDELDVAFVWGPANEPHIVNDYVCSFALEWLGAPRFAAGATVMDVVDVARLPFIPSKKGASDYEIVNQYFAAYGIERPAAYEDRVSLSSYSLATSVQLIRTGLGVKAMSPLLMAGDIRSGDVAILPVHQPLPPIGLSACYRSVGARPFVPRLVEMARAAARDYAPQVDPAYFWI